MIRIAICDDMPDQLEIIEKAARTYFHSIKEVVEIDKFTKAMDFLDAFEKEGNYDIALLDICMPGMMGTEVAEELRKQKSKCEIVFLSTSDEFGVEAFAVGAVHYLVKPFTQEKFDGAMKRVMEMIYQRHSKKLILHPVGSVRVVEVNDILFIKSEKHVQHVYLSDESVLEIRQSLSSLMETIDKVAPGQFASPSKGYYVNQKQIVSIKTGGSIELKNHEIPLSRRKSREFQENYFEYIFFNF